MNQKNNIKLLESLAELGEVVHLDTTKKAFIHHFCNLDIHGVATLLCDNHSYENCSKTSYLKYLQIFFEDLKTRKIKQLVVYEGKCTDCSGGQDALTFIDEKSRDYINLAIVIKDNKIIDMNLCFGVKHNIMISKGIMLEIIPWSSLRI